MNRCSCNVARSVFIYHTSMPKNFIGGAHYAQGDKTQTQNKNLKHSTRLHVRPRCEKRDHDESKTVLGFSFALILSYMRHLLKRSLIP